MNVFFKAYCRTYQAMFRVAMKIMNFRQPDIVNGLKDLPDTIANEKIDSVLIVTDDVLHNKLCLIDGLKASLEEKGIKYVVYDKTVPNPTIGNIEDALVLYKENGCKGIVAFGGGSPMDCAKGVACRVARPKKQISQLKGVLKVMKKVPTIFAIPTTSGTGSEATVAAIVSNPETHEKYPVNDPVLIPKYAVLEPELTVGLPKHITSTTGMDALTHAVEAYIGGSNTDLTESMAVKATKLIFENLISVYDDGSNLKKRKNMQWASYFAGIAFTRAYVGNVHSLAHALGGMYGTPHGLANAVLLPYVLEWYGSSAYVRLAELANAVGIKGPSPESKAKQFIAKIKEMNEYMGIPTQLKGIKEEDLAIMAERSFKEANPLYPVPKIMSKEDMIAIYRKIAAPEESAEI